MSDTSGFQAPAGSRSANGGPVGHNRGTNESKQLKYNREYYNDITSHIFTHAHEQPYQPMKRQKQQPNQLTSFSSTSPVRFNDTFRSQF